LGSDIAAARDRAQGAHKFSENLRGSRFNNITLGVIAGAEGIARTQLCQIALRQAHVG
jgi:hypothetical protein